MILLAVSFLGLLRCQSVQEWLDLEGTGTQLPVFQAQNGRYFPGFIRDFFPAGPLFETAYPSLPLAREQMLVIEVKRLHEGQEAHNEANLSWSSDSHYLGYEITTGKQRKILVKNLIGDYSEELAVLENKSTDFLRGMIPDGIKSYNAGLRWSLDRAEFVFMSNGGKGDFNLYLGGINREKRPIAESPTKDGYAVWSPKERQIAFVSARSGNGDIYLADLASSEPLRLSSSESFDIFPEWFPDGQQIVYCSGESSNHNLMVIKKAGDLWGPAQRLTDWEGDDIRPTVSPGGDMIAFYSSQADGRDGQRRWDLHVVRVEAGKTYRAVDLKKSLVAKDVVVDLNTGVAWTPDGRKIFYVKKDPKLFNPIMGYDLSSGKSYLLQTGTKMNRDIMMSSLGILSFRSQVGAWDRVFLALTNQGKQIQGTVSKDTNIVYPERF
jgi:hypothetical protein